MNEQLTEKLLELTHIYELLGDDYRSRAFQTAVVNINKSARDLKKYPPDLGKNKIAGVGKGIIGHIDEFIRTGDISEISKLKKTREYQAYTVFSKILGVGPAVIKSWIRNNIYTMSDLKRAAADGVITLTHMQKIGVLYYNDLNQRIPRAEVVATIDSLLDCLMTGIIFTVAGSYRRGADTVGDIDLLITSKRSIPDYLHRVEKCVKRLPGYVDTVSSGPQRLTFIYRHDAVCRQIDLLFLPYESYYAALCYFTGSYRFNINMRGTAKQRGFRLNQTGLYKKNRAGMYKIIPVDSEQQLFDIIGMKWVDPSDRN